MLVFPPAQHSLHVRLAMIVIMNSVIHEIMMIKFDNDDLWSMMTMIMMNIMIDDDQDLDTRKDEEKQLRRKKWKQP